MGFNNANSYLSTEEVFIQFEHTDGIPYYKLYGVDIVKRYNHSFKNGGHFFDNFIEIFTITIQWLYFFMSDYNLLFFGRDTIEISKIKTVKT